MKVQDTQNWLPLTDYSAKHRVSISTLRRRIKANEIQYKLDDNRYLILDDSNDHHGTEESHRPSQGTNPRSVAKSSEGTTSLQTAPPAQMKTTAGAVSSSIEPSSEEGTIAAANRLLIELKRAYSQVLQEKEEQLLQLRDEVADLHTLVKVLEDENDRLQMKNGTTEVATPFNFEIYSET